MDTIMIGNAPEPGGAEESPAVTQQVEALRRRSAHLYQTDRIDELEACLKQILALRPNDSVALYNLGVLYHGRGELGQAEHHLIRLIAADPDYLDAYLALGGIYYSTRQLLKAINAYERGLARAPTRLPLLGALLVARLAERVPSNIRSVCERIIAIDYENPDANTFLAWALITMGDNLAEALTCADRALSRDPMHPQATAMRYQALVELRREDEAAALWRQMAERAESDWLFAKNVSLIATQLRKKTQLAEIPNIYLRHNPDDNDAIAHVANTFMMDGDFPAGHELVKKVAEVLPDNKIIQMTLALSGFRLRDFGLFHKFHDMRWERDGAEKRWDIGIPAWDGRPLPDQAVLIYSEQGVGDHIMWASALPALQSRATRVYVETNSRLNSLFARSFPEYAIVTREHLPPNWNTKAIGGMASAANIPALLDLSFDEIPGRNGFLIPDPSLALKLRARYQAMFPGKKLIGISWRSGNRDSAAIRSLELSEWGPILSNPDCAFVNLQYGDVTRDVEFAQQTMGVEIFWDREINPLGNMDPFAAQIAALDLVISVDNSTIHFAGAIGKPTWALLPVNSDWRWLAETRDSLWYASLVLFRQQPGLGWDPLVAELADRLRRLDSDEITAANVAMMRRCGDHAFKHGRLDVAEDFYRALLAIDRHRAEALHVIGHCARIAGHPKDAVAITAGALEQAPDRIEYRTELALALDACGEGERAERMARDTLKRAPENAPALLAMGRILCQHRRETEATDYFARVLRSDPRHVEARTALAQAQAIQGDWDLAKRNFELAIQHAPLDANSHLAFAEAALRQGDFGIGWEHFRWRFGSGFGDLPGHLAMLDPQIHPMTWAEGNLRKARLHLRAERSVLEQLLLLSLLPEIQGETRSIMAEVALPLLPLLRPMLPKVTLEAAGSVGQSHLEVGRVSLSSSLGDLARRFRGDRESFSAKPWLDPRSLDRSAALRAEYQQCFPGRPLVGLSWRGENADNEQLLARFLPLLKDPAFGVVSVQRGADRGALASFAAEAGCDFAVDPRIDGMQDLAAYAGQLAALDVVVAEDDLTAVLALGLGRQTVKLCRSGTEHWAWGLSGPSCVWGGNVHIMREATDPAQGLASLRDAVASRSTRRSAS
ncbi:tetratricopeptide repeat protein [Dongia sp.]|uniref:tetratricopeptide repeat protein n=1 Tax=Dongia sp. TaxID=1977262 RepID=UPI0035B17A60